MEILRKENLTAQEISEKLASYSNSSKLNEDVDDLNLEKEHLRKIIKLLKNQTGTKEKALVSILYTHLGEYLNAATHAQLSFETARNQFSFTLLINCFFENINYFLERDSISEAENQIKDIETLLKDYSQFDTFSTFRNILETRKWGLKDYKLMHVKTNDLKELVSHSNKKLQWDLIQILGLFTAVIVFIFSSLNIQMKAVSVSQSKFLIISTGLILLIFPLMINLLFPNESNKGKWLKIVFLLALIIILGILIQNY